MQQNLESQLFRKLPGAQEFETNLDYIVPLKRKKENFEY